MLNLDAFTTAALADLLQKLATERDSARSLLCDINDELVPYEDVDDGSDGEPRPNFAMRILVNISRELDAAEGK